MPATPCRNFTILDGLILIAATAVGLALARPFIFGMSGWARSHFLVILGQPLLVSWTPAVLAIRLRKPRQSTAPLFRELGAAASLVASVMIAIWAMILASAAWRTPLHLHSELVEMCALFVAPSIIGTWITLLTNRAASMDPGWIDRFGRLIGVAWLFLFFSIILIPYR